MSCRRGGSCARAAKSWRSSSRPTAIATTRKRRETIMADIHPMKTAAETALAEAYGVLRERLPGSDEARALRADAIAVFREQGLPHRRVEEWKYTDLRALMREARPLAPAPDSIALDKARLPSA